MKFIKAICIAASLPLLVGCDSLDDDYTPGKDIIVTISEPNSIFADSLTLHTIDILTPGLKAQGTQNITLTTNWGTWLNKSQTITLSATYQKEASHFSSSTQLIPGRTVQPALITVNVNGVQAETAFTPIPRYPDFIQVVPDSFSVKLKLGNNFLVRAYPVATVGYPSYGTRFSFVTNQNITLLPVQTDFGPNRPLRARAILSTTALPFDTLVISTSITGPVLSPMIRPAKVFLRR